MCRVAPSAHQSEGFETFQKEAAALSSALEHGIQEGAMSGHALLTVRCQPGLHISNAPADQNVQLLLRQLSPEKLAVVELSPQKSRLNPARWDTIAGKFLHAHNTYDLTLIWSSTVVQA